MLLFAQFDYHRELSQWELEKGDVRFSISSGISKFVTTKNKFLESKVSLRFATEYWEFGTYIRLNNQINFEIPSDDSFLNISDDQTVFINPNLILTNESYQISKPISLFATRHFGAIDVTVDLSPVFRLERIWTPLINQIDSTTYTISNYEDIRNQADFVSGVLASTTLEPFIFFAGISSLSVARIGDTRSSRMDVVPMIGVGIMNGISWLNLITNFSDVRVQHLQSFYIPWLTEERSVYFRLQGQLSKRLFSSYGASCEVIAPISERMQLSAGYTAVRSKSASFSEKDLKNWYVSVSPPWDEDMESRLPHSSVKIGIQYDLRKESQQSFVQLLRSNFQRTDIYFAKRDFYAYNSVGEIIIRNTASDMVDCRFVLEIEGGLGTYRTEQLRLEPNQTITVPLFLYLPDVTIQKSSETKEMHLSLLERGKEWKVTTVPVTVHEAHHWDGDTKNLHFFLTPEDPTIITNARKILLSSAEMDSSKTVQQRMFFSLKRFITALGRNLKYVSDPTTTFVTDRVQYPVETLEQQAGDCEDLVVYTATSLMSIGYQCAVVDILPASKNRSNNNTQKDVGHVFLLVDTGIETEHAFEINLVDVEWIARKSVNGKSTIWIPVETTVLNKGFDEASRSGVIQYYEHVIAPEEFRQHSVRVVDF